MTRQSMQRRVAGIAGTQTSNKNPSFHNRTSSERHPYQRSENWLKPEWHFWENSDNGISYTDKSKEYYREWVEGQRKIATRQCKENAIS